ncbi:MAG: 4Fe-4S dicluster domain-containing protein, partial [Myxococcota bacterium]
VLQQVKQAFDPQGIFNPHKIVDVLPMDTDLRYPPGYQTYEIPTALSFKREQGYVRAAEFCNGAGACRKSHMAQGGMCPSYQATLEERNSTRGRANVLRKSIAKYGPRDAFKSHELHETMNLCLECKLCKSECPSNVDMAKLKYEYLQRRRDIVGTNLSELAVAFMPTLTRLGVPFFFLFNWLVRYRWGRVLFEKLARIDARRDIPKITFPTLRLWFRFWHRPHPNAGTNGKTVHFLADPFINYNEPHVGMAAIRVLEAAGYRVELSKVRDDGRTLISKGFTRRAKNLAERNLWTLRSAMERGIPLIGVEPSTILTLRDEYRDFFPGDPAAALVAQNTYMIDEFLVQQATQNDLKLRLKTLHQEVLVHGHCFQKALASVDTTLQMLELIPGLSACAIPSGCCGMAGSFGYDKDKYDVSMKVGELVLFPAVRKREGKTVLAVGTSCRHQIYEGTEYQAKHPIEMLAEAMVDD